MQRWIFAICAVALVSGCNQGSQDQSNAAANAPANQTATASTAKHYCFFHQDEGKAWATSRDAQGNVTVKGKAHVRDVRYKADLGQPEILGSSAKLWLTMAQNTGYRSMDNWWDVSFTIPGSGAIESVTVACDQKRVMAELKVKRAG
jgi:hypothetical protein